MAIGTVSGALLAAGRDKPRFRSLMIGAATFGLGCTLAAVAPSYWMFACALTVIGVAALTFTNTTNSLMQLSTEPRLRGRVMALRVGIALGGTPIGAPIVGWVADHAGPRWALGVGAASGFAAAGERQSSLQRNSREIGMLNATGVDFAALQAIERRRALRTTLKATLVAAPTMVLVAAAFNASELGVHIGVGVTEVTVGFSLTLAAMLAASRRALNQFRRSLDLPLAVKG